jgi:uncharacterized protein YfiM (DUF2279 family)
MIPTRVAFVLLALLLCVGTPRPSAQSIDLSAQDVERLRVYHERIVETVRRIPGRASLAELVRPVMSLASDRSADGRAADENRAAILAIAFYVNGKPLSMLTPEARTWPRAERRRLLLHGRGDLSQHFTISAALSASAGAPVANLIGLYKEIDDARRGSGFSFVDLTADRAGTAFGRVATESLDSARQLQSRVRASLPEDHLIPAIDGLPENLSQGEFTRRYRGAGAPAYEELLEEIDRRIAALPLFQSWGS